MSDRPTNGNGYTAEVSALDIALDIRIGEIRGAQDRHEITVRQAADKRVKALTEHLAAVKALRAEYFGNDDE